ncbi:PREDICTED: uncharacterized protein LOC109582159 [Amphimedon queenslandica]|uniref:Uncharacterized protein n=2 Tax=Amphimedon queenslandica TaxID=400682 RepID=A0AAN0J5Q3_AMPQE|nr:PREDICTED: uncharacterized protein LOC109582159 [Amphimedon queenslandica]|eukprot:XP_019852350.1 PREDICTED: uncharacterized protein LOC109582159 [Amphimedon queenslandica]
MAQAVVASVLVLLALFTAGTRSDEPTDSNTVCSYGIFNNKMSVSISIATLDLVPIGEIYFTNPLTLKNETIHFIKNDIGTYYNNSFFMAKRGPLMSAHMKYIPVYQQYSSIDAVLLTTVDFCLSGISAEAIIAIVILIPLFIIICYVCCIAACILYACKKKRKNKSSPLITTAGIDNEYGGTK